MSDVWVVQPCSGGFDPQPPGLRRANRAAAKTKKAMEVVWDTLASTPP